MSKKKDTSLPVSQEEQTQVQHLLAQFHEIASTLHGSANEDDAKASLTGINNISEAAQVALLKALSKEHDADAADILIAVNELSPIKNVRKEARRSLIRLEEAMIYPRWQPPVARTLFIQPVAEGDRDMEMRPAPPFPLDFEFTFDPEDAVYEFIELWSGGEYELAYELLSSDSELREGLSQEEWAERRDTWAEQAQPEELLIAFVRERKQDEANPEPPLSSVGDQPADTLEREVEISWSLELKDTPAGETLKEMPEATAIYKETGRHWFWTSYTLVKEEDEWLIRSMTDQGMNAQNLPIEELESRVDKLDTQLKELVRQKKLDEIDFSELEDIDTILEEPRWIAAELLHYDDALIARRPQDQSMYDLATIHAVAIEALERAAVYIELQVERFPEQRAENLQKLALMQLAMSERDYEGGLEEEGEKYHTLSISTLRGSLALKDDVNTRIMLANMLFDDDQLDEAEDQLRQAEALAIDDEQKALVEFSFGDIAEEREQYDQALHHFRRAVEFDSTDAEAWLSLGKCQYQSEQTADAEASFQRSIELDPHNFRAYTALGRIYVESQQWPKAHEILEQGLQVNPDSAELRVYLALVLLEKGDRRRAEKLLDEAEDIDPELELTPMVRRALKQFGPQKPDSKKKKRSRR